MKNSISRRSFLKKSTVAAVAAANASLLTGLSTAQDTSGGWCDIWTQWFYVLHVSDEVFPTREEAQDAGDCVVSDPSGSETPWGPPFIHDYGCSGVPDSENYVEVAVSPP